MHCGDKRIPDINFNNRSQWRIFEMVSNKPRTIQSEDENLIVVELPR